MRAEVVIIYFIYFFIVIKFYKNMLNSKPQLQEQYFLNSNKNINLTSSSVHMLLKSKSCLDKLGTQISEGKNFNKNGTTIKCIEQAAKDIKNTIESKIQGNFTSLLNQQTKVNLEEPMHIQLQGKQKQQATKKLMQDYWQKRQQSQSEARRKTALACKQNILPKIKNNQNNIQNQPGSGCKSKKKAIISSLNVKIYQKQKQRESLKKQKEEKILAYLYSYMVHVIDYKVQNDTPQFLLFQKLNYAKWDEIQHILKTIENFSRKYELKYCVLDLQKALQLISSKTKEKSIKAPSANITFTNINMPGFESTGTTSLKQAFTPHQLLGCLENSQEISAKNSKKAGIRFFGNRGKLRAIIKIQSIWRGKIIYNKTKRIIEMIKKITKIQRAYRIHLTYCKTRQLIRSNCLQKYEWFKQKQQNFKAAYRLNQMSRKIKYQIHICSDSQNQWQRVSTQRFVEKQNSYLTRIFKAFKQSQTQHTRIIFVTARSIPTEVFNYYSKLLEIGGAKNYRSRVIFLAPEQCETLLDKIPLARVIYYCPALMKKIKSLINNQYAYIVPSTPSVDYIQLCHALDLPIYSSNPQALLYLSSNSGCKSLINQINKNNAFEWILPYAMNIYSLPTLVNQLTNLIQFKPFIWRWILKIDNEHNSRGLAYIEVNKILPKKLLKSIRKIHQEFVATQQNCIAPEIKSMTKQIYNSVYQSLYEGQKLTIVNKSVYRSQKQFLNFFLANGGIVEAEVSHTQTESQNLCFCIEIQPDYQWRFVCNYKKITIKKRTLACYYDSQLVEPPIQIQLIVRQLIKRKLIGFFVLDFVKQPNRRFQNSIFHSTTTNLSQQSIQKNEKNKRIYFNGIKCYLDVFSSATYMREFISKQSNVLYIPYIPHQNIKKITMTTFFHLCRLQNISFDIERKIGNIFMFLDGMQAGCLGTMTFNDSSKMEAFIHAAQVLDFFSSKIDHSVSSGPPEEFLLIRNCINGYLNNLRKKKLGVISIKDAKSSKSIKNIKKLEPYRQKEYLT